MPEQLKIVIDADVVKALGGLDKVKKGFQATEDAANKFSKSIFTNTTRTNAAFNKTTNSANSATLALSNVGRVAQDLPFGFLGIANNLNPLLESFQRLKAETGSTGKALSALGSSLSGAGGIGLALSVVSSLLIVFGDKLFGGKAAAVALNIEMGKLSSEVTAAKDSLKQFNSELEFLKELSSLRITLNVNESGQQAINNLQVDFVQSQEKVLRLSEDITAATKRNEKATAAFFEKASAGTIDAIRNFGRLIDVPEEISKSFSEQEQSLFSTAKKTGEALIDLQTDQTKALQSQSLIRFRLRVQEQTNTKDSLEKQQRDFENFQAAILSRAREFVKEFGGVFIVPDLDISFTNTKEKVFTAAKKLLDDIDKGLLQLKLVGPRQVTIPIELDFSFKESLQKTRDNLFKDANIFGDNTKIIKGIVPGASEDVAKRNKAFFDEFQKQILATADLITGVLAPAFTGMFDAIVAGENPLKAFFKGLTESVNQLIKKLIAAAIQAVVLSALSGGSTSFGGAFSKIFGLAGSANGGGFGLGGAIAGRSFNNVIQIVGSSTISGNDIVTSYSRATNSNSRFGG